MQLLWLVPALPLLGALLLAIFGGMMPRRAAAAVGCASVGLSWLASMSVAAGYLGSGRGAYHQTLFGWIDVGSFRVSMGFYLDQLSAVMMVVVAFVSFIKTTRSNLSHQ